MIIPQNPNRKEVPCFSTEFTVIVPLCNAIICFDKLSPIPEPLGLEVNMVDLKRGGKSGVDVANSNLNEFLRYKT